jgi:hypothetical protein
VNRELIGCFFEFASLLLFFAPAGRVDVLLDQIVASGQVTEIATPAAERLSTPPQIAPGAPPLLAFRTLEGTTRHRFGDLGLVMDDAGH